MMKIQKLVGTIGTMLSLALDSTTARADEYNNRWKNIGPIVSEDMSTNVDFQIERDYQARPTGPASYKYTAKPLWVNIHRPGLSSQDNVFVQIISYETNCYRGNCYSGAQTIVERNLDFADADHFTGEMGSLVLDSQSNDGYALSSKKSLRQELVIWINGRLYKDPQGRNFQLQMSDAK